MTDLPPPKMCEIVYEFANFTPWKILLIIKTGIAVLAVFASYFLIRHVGTRWLVHQNARILFGNHIFWSALSPILYIALYIIDLIRLSRKHENPCDYLVSTKFALFFRTLHVNAAMAQNFSVLTLSIERVFSVFLLRKYEKITSPALGIILLIFATASCLLLPYIIYVFPFLDTPMLSSYTPTISHRNEFNSEAAPWVSYIQLMVEFTALILFHITLCYSRVFLKARMKQRVHSVSQAYQAKENENIVRPVLFVFWTHFFICVAQAGATGSFKWFGPDAPLTTFAFYLEVFTQFPLYTIILTLLLHPRSCLRRKKRSVINKVQKQEEYFNDLKVIFNAELSKNAEEQENARPNVY